MDGDRRALAGCGPIAMVQVVRGMEYPPRSPRDSALYAWNLGIISFPELHPTRKPMYYGAC